MENKLILHLCLCLKKGMFRNMLIKDAFEEVFTGFNMNNSQSDDKYVKDVYFIQKDTIQYVNIIPSKLIKKRANYNIKNKYIMKDRDIIISLKKPYKVGTYKYKIDKTVIIPNNFIILRGINMDLYSYIFVSNYLEKIGLEKYYIDNKINERPNKELSLEDILNIELPNIPKEEQMKISNLMNKINERSAIYSTILENDNQIIKYALNKVIGDRNDK